MTFASARRLVSPFALVTSLITARAAFVPSVSRSEAFKSTATSVSQGRIHLLSRRQDAATQLDMSTSDLVPGRPTWQQTMLRIRDPAKSVAFYTDLLGFTLIDTFDFPQYKFSLYFLTTLPEGETYDLTPGTQEAHDYLWSMEGVALELTHNHGTEEEGFKGYHTGNENKDGFGHIAVK